jgi:hypothetical protein
VHWKTVHTPEVGEAASVVTVFEPQRGQIEGVAGAVGVVIG